MPEVFAPGDLEIELSVPLESFGASAEQELIRNPDDMGVVRPFDPCSFYRPPDDLLFIRYADTVINGQ